MNSVKILHCADVHIGAVEGFLGSLAESRRYETLITFEKIIDTAVQNGVSLLLIAGDLFDSNDIPLSFVDKVFEKIALAPQLKVVFCAGNHDPLNSTSPFKIRRLPENLYVLGCTDSVFVFDDIKTRVYGRSFEDVYLKGEETFTQKVPNDDYINILLQHGELRNDLGSNYNSITPKFLKTCQMDYVALGHVHKATPIGKVENTHLAYCGCPEGQGFDELGEKGVYIGEVAKGNCNLEFLPISHRKHIHEKIDITNVEDICNHILTTLNQKFGENYTSNLYKMELTGSINQDCTINTTELATRLSQTVYFAKVKDSTEFLVDFETIANETTLKGIFVKTMLKKQAEAENPDLYKKALNLGLRAFNSEVKYNED